MHKQRRGLVTWPISLSILLIIMSFLPLQAQTFDHPLPLTPDVDEKLQAYLLIGAGIILMLAEVWLPSFGLIGVAGFFGIILGVLLIAHPSASLGIILSSWEFAVPLCVLAFISLFLCYMGFRSQKRRVRSGREALIGLSTEALEDFHHHQGQVRANGEIWNATSPPGRAIKRGDRVDIVAVEGLNLIVHPQHKTE